MGQILGKNEKQRTQEDCIARMKAGGMTADERMSCFDVFFSSGPDATKMQAFYDAWGRDYDYDVQVGEYTIPALVAERMASYFSHDKSIWILDIGAGSGQGALELKKLGYTNVDGLDGSLGMLEKARASNAYQHLYHELLQKGKKVYCAGLGAYDVAVSSGSFYPLHLQGHHLDCFLDCVKECGLVVLSSAPANDEGVGLQDKIQQLVSTNTVEILLQEFIPRFNRHDDGTLWILKKCAASKNK